MLDTKEIGVVCLSDPPCSLQHGHLTFEQNEGHKSNGRMKNRQYGYYKIETATEIR